MSNEYRVRCFCSSPSPKKPSTFDVLWVPLRHSDVARHWNFAASGASVSAVRAPRSASTFTPLLTGVAVEVIWLLLVGIVRSQLSRGNLILAGTPEKSLVMVRVDESEAHVST